jgi:hypothetical protein
MEEMVADHGETLSFSSFSRNVETGATTWSLDITRFKPRSRHVGVVELLLTSEASFMNDADLPKTAGSICS